MIKIQHGKASKLSVIDKKVLNVYASMSMETGRKETDTPVHAKDILNKSIVAKL